MYYVLFNPKSGNVKEKSLLRLEKYFKKRNLNYKMLNYLDYSFEDIDVLTEKDFLVLAGGDGTINHFLSEEKRDKITKILLYKAGSGNDFAREHKGFLVDITEELKKAPYYLINDNKHYFINGVGMGIDAAVCDAVNLHKDGSYFKTAVNIIKAKSYKKIIPVFPLIYLGLHKIARSNVVHLRGKNIKVSLSEKQMMQADGEVVHDLSNIEIHSN